MKHVLFVFLAVLSVAGNLYAELPFAGIWENDGRLIAYTASADGTGAGTMRAVLKLYYRFVYKDMGTFPFTVAKKKTRTPEGTYSIDIRYPNTKKTDTVSFWMYADSLFFSYYIREDYDSPQKKQDETVIPSGMPDTETGRHPSSDSLYGFWIEQGDRSGLLLYPQETPAFFDAFFFTENRYIKFRYWKDDLEYSKKKASFTVAGTDTVKVPKLIMRNNEVYSCISGNGSILRNYEKGSWQLEKDGDALFLTLTPDAGGPGSHAAGDIYPHHQHPHFTHIPFFVDTTQGVFSFGSPFLKKSDISSLDEEISERNSRKRPPPEPFFAPDELDFRWERIKELRKQ